MWRLGLQGVILDSEHGTLPAVTPPKPALYYAVTLACPRHCAFCFNHAVPRALRRFDNSAYLAVVRAMADFAHDGLDLRLNLSGGEPLAHPRIGELALEASDLGLRVAVTTAGVRISDRQIEALIAAGTDLSFSFDCADEDVYERTRGRQTYRLARESLAVLTSAGLLGRAIVVVTRDTSPHLEATVALLAGHGVAEFIVMEVTGSPGLFDRVGVRLPRERVAALHEAHPHARFVLGHQCPVTLNVSPGGTYYVQNPQTDSVEFLGRVDDLGLPAAYVQYSGIAARQPVRASEILEARAVEEVAVR
jgi:pyruvate-formate lyase-activating enzyme